MTQDIETKQEVVSTTISSHPEAPGNALAGKPRRKFPLVPVAVTIALVLTMTIFFTWQYFSAHESTDDAYIDAHMTSVSSKVEGNVLKVFVEDNQMVKQGQLLAIVDPTDYQVKVEKYKAAADLAEHQLATAEQTVTETKTNAQAQDMQADGDVTTARAAVSAASENVAETVAHRQQQSSQVISLQAQAKQASKDLERFEKLDAKGAVSKEELDQARTTYDVAIAQLQAGKQLLQEDGHKIAEAKAALDEARGRLARASGTARAAQATHVQAKVNEEEVTAAKAYLKQAQADLKDAADKLGYTELRAPISGRIGRKAVEIGQRVEIGQALMFVVDPNPWVSANFKETQVGHMHRGQIAVIKIDSLPDVVFKGTIDSLSPASGAKFALLPPENATGNFTKIVQRIPVKIIFDDASIAAYKDRINPGMSCDVTINLK